MIKIIYLAMLLCFRRCTLSVRSNGTWNWVKSWLAVDDIASANAWPKPRHFKPQYIIVLRNKWLCSSDSFIMGWKTLSYERSNYTFGTIYCILLRSIVVNITDGFSIPISLMNSFFMRIVAVAYNPCVCYNMPRVFGPHIIWSIWRVEYVHRRMKQLSGYTWVDYIN